MQLQGRIIKSPVNSAEVIVVSQLTEVFNFDHFYKFSCGRYAQVTFVEKTQLKVIFHKHCYLIHT